MIYEATRKIEAAFLEEEFKCRVSETPAFSAVEAGFSGANTSVVVRFISADNDPDVAVRIISLAQAPEDKRGAVLEAINALHRRFRYATFSVDDDGDVNIAFDFPLRTSDPGQLAVEMFVRLSKIADEAYPELMKAIWA